MRVQTEGEQLVPCRRLTLQYWLMAFAVAVLLQAGVRTCAPSEAPEAVEPAANLK